MKYDPKWYKAPLEIYADYKNENKDYKNENSTYELEKIKPTPTQEDLNKNNINNINIKMKKEIIKIRICLPPKIICKSKIKTNTLNRRRYLPPKIYKQNNI